MTIAEVHRGATTTDAAPPTQPNPATMTMTTILTDGTTVEGLNDRKVRDIPIPVIASVTVTVIVTTIAMMVEIGTEETNEARVRATAGTGRKLRARCS